LGFDLLCFDYRGYGKSTGKPNFRGVFDDCCAVIDFARKDLVIRNRSFIIFGQSLGGAFSISATAEKLDEDIFGMILDSTFNSFQEIMALKAPLLLKQVPKIFITDRFNPEKFINKLEIPKIFINSTNDSVVPYKLGYKLYKLAPELKEFIKLSNSPHLSLFSIQRDSSQWKSVISLLNNLSFLSNLCDRELAKIIRTIYWLKSSVRESVKFQAISLITRRDNKQYNLIKELSVEANKE
jgi:hypothetical protein